ncbi:transglutaminase domain-containing protein [Flectobacillus major]|uniref:transglutaminase domain-containing protein n=1 Tax=Flectobacillus major TaxID=103 RepID=UPI00047C3DA1|nr:transglutaminase domain-containing protein [Flectobacillus major]
MKYILSIVLLAFLPKCFSQNPVKKLAAQLTSTQPTDSLKMVAIFHWITDNIHYDFATFNERLPTLDLGNTQSSAVVLSSKKAICGGYANIFYDLCQYAGLKTQIIEGFGKVRNSSNPADSTFRIESHAWNAVKINQKWYLIDLTWSAGAMINDQFQQRKTWDFYLTIPSQFLLTHYPFDPLWQLSDNIITEKEFIKGPPFRYSRKFPLGKTLLTFEQLDSTSRVVSSQERILQHDPNNNNAYNTLGFHYAMKSTQILENYTAISRKIRENKIPHQQQQTALTYKEQLFSLLNQAEVELNKALDYYNHIAPQALIKGVNDNKNSIFMNLEAIRKDREMMNKYYSAMSKNKR